MMGLLVYLPKLLVDRKSTRDFVAPLLALFGAGGFVGALVAGPVLMCCGGGGGGGGEGGGGG